MGQDRTAENQGNRAIKWRSESIPGKPKWRSCQGKKGGKTVGSKGNRAVGRRGMKRTRKAQAEGDTKARKAVVQKAAGEYEGKASSISGKPTWKVTPRQKRQQYRRQQRQQSSRKERQQVCEGSPSEGLCQGKKGGRTVSSKGSMKERQQAY